MAASSLSFGIASAPDPRPRVLVVDDEQSMRELLKLHLTKSRL